MNYIKIILILDSDSIDEATTDAGNSFTESSNLHSVNLLNISNSEETLD